MWGFIIGAAYAHLATDVRPGGIIRVDSLSDIHGVYEYPMPVARTSKCPCCGSRQFVIHHARRICAYCRSEQ